MAQAASGLRRKERLVIAVPSHQRRADKAGDEADPQANEREKHGSTVSSGPLRVTRALAAIAHIARVRLFSSGTMAGKGYAGDSRLRYAAEEGAPSAIDGCRLLQPRRTGATDPGELSRCVRP